MYIKLEAGTFRWGDKTFYMFIYMYIYVLSYHIRPAATNISFGQVAWGR